MNGDANDVSSTSPVAGETPDATNQIAPTFSLFDEISDVLEWSHNRAAPLAFIGLSIATLLWVDFLRLYAIPVSFFSSSLIAGLPALFATVTSVVMLLSVNSVVPAFALCVPLYEGGPSLASAWQATPDKDDKTPTDGVASHKIDEHAPCEDDQSLPSAGQAHTDEGSGSAAPEKLAPVGDKKNNQPSPKPLTGWHLVRVWLALPFIAGAFLSIWLAVASLNVTEAAGWFPYAVFAVSTFAGFLIFWSRFKKMKEKHSLSWDFLLQFSLSIILQNVVAFSILYVLLRTTFDTKPATIFFRVFLYILMLFIVGMVQLLVAKRVILGGYQHMLRHVTIGTIALMAMIAVASPLGGLLATYPLRVTAPDGSSCLVLNFSAISTTQRISYTAILESRISGHTVPLNFVTHFDDMYYVKPQQQDQIVYAIPASSLSAFSNCPKPN